MIGISEFVRGTLAYLSNCAIALLTLIGWALRFRPIKGALRCKLRSELAPSETPDSRVMLFIACCLFGTVLTYAVHGFIVTVTALSQAVVGIAAVPNVATITSILFYFVCERAIVNATSRTIAPGRRGNRNRHVLRFLVASLLIQVAIYEPIAVNLLSKVPDISWFKLTGKPSSIIGDFYDDVIMVPRLIILLGPFFYLWAALEKSKSLLRGDKLPHGLTSLPLDLLGAGLAGSLLAAFLYPPVEPKLVTLSCQAVMGKDHDEVEVKALIRNDGDQYWTPQPGLKVNILGEPQYNPFTKETSGFETYSDAWPAARTGERSEQLLIGPHQEVRFLGHVTFQKGDISPRTDTSCSLSNKRPKIGLFDAFSKNIPDEDLEWQAVTPADFKVGDISFDMTNATQEDLNAAAPDTDDKAQDMGTSNSAASTRASKK